LPSWVNKILPYVLLFHEIWTQYGSKDIHINLLNKSEFRENIQGESCALLKVLNEFLSYFSQFFPDFSEIGYEYMLCRISVYYLHFS